MMCRLATLADCDAILALYQELAGNSTIGGANSFAKVLDHEGSEIWCREKDGALVAMATLHILPNVTQAGRPYAVIENVVTAQESRNSGDGRQVMKAAIEAAWGADCYKIMLMTGKTTQARGFYEALGFTSEEKWAMTLRRVPIRQGV